MKAIRIEDIVKATKGTLLSGNGSLLVTNVTTDSREAKEGTLFVPIVGERRDGHDFIPVVMEAGAVCTFTERNEVQTETGAYIKVEDSLKAMQDFAAWYRSLFPEVTLIGVTGSVGKTTTKEMIATVLEEKYKVLKTFGNMNSQVGLSRMMFELDETVEIAVIEMGISEFHEMDRLVQIAKPELAVLTNVGMSHIGNLLSRENICKEKSKIITCFPKGGKLYICSNGDLKEMSQSCIDTGMCENGDCEFVYYGMENEPEYKAVDIQSVDGKMKFTYIHEESKEEITLGVLGEHNVSNALIALALAKRFEVPMDRCKKALYEYQPMKMRGEIIEVNGYTLIDDTYNASADSIKSGIAALFDRAGKNRSIAVLADVLELGKFSKEAHESVGVYIAEEAKKGKVLSELVTYGTEAKYISDYVMENSDKTVCHHFNEQGEVIDYLKSILKQGDCVLVKGSRGMAMDKVIAAVRTED